MLTLRRFKSSVNKVKTRTYPVVVIGSDHDFVLLVMKLISKKIKKPANSRIKFNRGRFEDLEIAEIFKAQIDGRFPTLNLLGKDINELTTRFNEAVLETAEKVFGRERKKQATGNKRHLGAVR